MATKCRNLSKIPRRFFGTSKNPEDIRNFTWSRGTIGRKVFNKGWKHLEPRYPVNLQERWHRAAVERLFHPSIVENVATKESGESDTMEYRIHFYTESIDPEKNLLEKTTEINEYSRLSPWHDIPFGFKDIPRNQLLFNFINEIPQNDRAKMECSTKDEWNPIKQDIKKGKLRYFKYGDLPFNYGFISQTWEDPNHESQYSDIPGLKGDNDPVDVVEISNDPINRGVIIPIKVISVLGLVDEGETDWKIIGLRADHPQIDQINSMSDADSVLGIDYSGIILDWFRNYKTADGKPENTFTHGDQYQTAEFGIDVIEECHRHWLNLMLGATPSNGLDLTSVTQKHLMAQGLTSSSELGELPKIEYPRYDDWSAKPVSKMSDIDSAQEEYEIDEEAPDQRTWFR